MAPQVGNQPTSGNRLPNERETVKKLSDRCHYLHTAVVKRVPDADYPMSEDALLCAKEESMADLIQHKTPKDQGLTSDQTPIGIKSEDRPSPARPEAPACPRQTEPTATKRQATQEAQLQSPPTQFPVADEIRSQEEQRPDPAKKAKPPSPPDELRTKE